MPVLQLPTLVPRKWKRTLTPEQFAAVGDDATDNDTAFASMIAATQEYDRWLFAPHATYRHNGVIKLVGKHNVTFDGWNSTLRATNGDQSAFFLDQCNDCQVNGLTHVVDSTARASSFESNAWTFTSLARLEVNGTKSVGSAATGYYIWMVNDSVFRDTETWDSRADGFHVTGGSRGIRSFNHISHNVGDDGVSCVSYGSDPNPTRDVWIKSPKVYGQNNGRGMTIVGGTNIHFSDIYIERSRAAGMMIAVEGPPPNEHFTTKGVSNCSVRGGQIVHCNAVAAGEGHGGLLILNQRPSSSGVTMDQVLIEDIEIRDVPKTNVPPIQVLNNAQATAVMTNIRLRKITLTGQRSTTPIGVDSGITLTEQEIIQGGKWATFGTP